MICEGQVDEAFFRALIAAHNLTDCCVRHGADLGVSKPGGINAIGNLFGHRNLDGFANITEILIVVDSDSDPTDNFNKVCSQVQAAQIDRMRERRCNSAHRTKVWKKTPCSSRAAHSSMAASTGL